LAPKETVARDDIEPGVSAAVLSVSPRIVVKRDHYGMWGVMEYVAGRLGVRVGTVGAYVGAADVEWVREVRRTTGRVTVSGRSGMRVVNELAKHADLAGVDVDPAGYLTQRPDQDGLFEYDSTHSQRELGLAVVRSQGLYVPRADRIALKTAMTEPIGVDVTRVVSLHRSWLRPPCLSSLLAAVGACDDPLAIVFADQFDPLQANGAVEGYATLVAEATDGGRPVEQLRTDVAAIPFAALGGRLGSVGLSTAIRHHGLPLRAGQQESYWDRQASPLVFVPALLSWHRGHALGALEPWGGAGLTDCHCSHCDGRSLLRFDAAWPGRLPPEVRDDVARHDVASWSALAARVLLASEPFAEWTTSCSRAVRLAAEIVAKYRVAIEPPRSVRQWSTMGG
jgi:hypothetical protein